MGQLYGCWLREDFDISAFTKNHKPPYREYFPFFQRRVDAIYHIANLYLEDMCEQHPLLRGKVYVSYVSVVSAIGRYVNDIMHYKLWHDVKIANKSKMIAHTIKWLTYYQVLCSSVSREDYAKLPTNDRSVLLEINTMFIATVIRYFLSFFCDGEIPSAKLYSSIFYLIDTGQYDAKTAAVAFDGLIL